MTGIPGTRCKLLFAAVAAVCLCLALAASAGARSADPMLTGSVGIGDAAAIPPVQQETLAVAKGGTGSGTVSSAPAGINCGPGCSSQSAAFDQGKKVTLTAKASASARFGGWSLPSCQSTGDTCVVTLDQSAALTADFIAEPTLKIVPSGTGSGTVTSAPAGISCGSSCSHAYDQGTKVTLSAVAAAGSRFTGWAGGGCPRSGNCVVTLTQSTKVSARFNAQVSLTVVKSGSGTGTVTSGPAGINCGTRCAATYDLGTRVRLAARPAGGTRFVGWSGAGCAGTAACTITLAQTTAVTAQFAEVVIPPATRITNLKKHRLRRHRHGRVTVWFTASQGNGPLTYRCKLDHRRFKRCSSPRTYRHLRRGRHTIQVKAIDSHGTADPTPARISFRL